jgi:thiamine phosphate synthase YjbQ (UPF0047 family)
MAHHVVPATTDRRLRVGPWEQVFSAEVDERRRQRLLLEAIGESSDRRREPQAGSISR